ncbi:Flp pilus assembly protein CpaB [Burkholderia gladioli]|uniref:Flp pilus assembly protein CpaB n=1 Tax=Burkholderia gladioli TaxID=28095 RepID=UPI000CDA5462|nr:Flp pilus assembly protein CpaB [Burkholderia gladioli]POS03236.1 Flp pilus assembly protein CpaB [Burkholderia gladioli]
MIFNRINYRSLLANTWLLIGIAVAAAGGITWATYRYMLVSEARIKAEAAERREGPGVSVVVPRADVPAGTPLDSAVFVAREISADLVYDDMLQVDDFTHHRNAVLVKPVRRGRPLRLQDVDVTRARDFSDTLAAGMRALTLPIDAINSTDSMLRPGNRVDLYWVGTLSFVTRGGDPAGDTKSIRLLMPGVLVLATGHDVRPRDAGEAARDMADGARSDGYATVTLQVPVAEAARIALAQKLGGLRLVLRNSKDPGDPVQRGLDETELFAARADAPADDRERVEIITGGGKSTTVQVAIDPVDVNVRSAAASAASPAGEPPSPVAPASAAGSAYRQANAIARRLQAETGAADASR